MRPRLLVVVHGSFQEAFVITYLRFCRLRAKVFVFLLMFGIFQDGIWPFYFMEEFSLFLFLYIFFCFGLLLLVLCVCTYNLPSFSVLKGERVCKLVRRWSTVEQTNEWEPIFGYLDGEFIDEENGKEFTRR